MGKTQIATILKHEAEIRASYATFAEITREIDKVDTRKLTMFCRKGILWLEDLLIQSMDQCSKNDVKASSGWLEKWKNSYGISQRAIEGESGEVQMQTSVDGETAWNL